MKNNFNDKELELAAKNIVEGIARQCYIEPDEKPDDNTISIKLAKAKAGARRHINRTIRICAVAAVLMVGLVCALFMGAENDEKTITISYTKDAYMFKNFDPNSECNMPVKVTIDLKEVEKTKSDKNNDASVLLSGNVIIKDLDGNIIVEYNDVDNYYDADRGSFIIDEYLEATEGKIERDESGTIIMQDFTKFDLYDLGVLQIYFEREFGSFMMLYHEKGEVIVGDKQPYKLKDAVIIVDSVYTREEAVTHAEEVYNYIWKDSPNYDKYGEKID